MVRGEGPQRASATLTENLASVVCQTLPLCSIAPRCGATAIAAVVAIAAASTRAMINQDPQQHGCCSARLTVAVGNLAPTPKTLGLPCIADMSRGGSFGIACVESVSSVARYRRYKVIEQRHTDDTRRCYRDLFKLRTDCC